MIIEAICSVKGLSKDEINSILKNRECKYLLFLLLRKYKCENTEVIKRDFSLDISKRMNYNIRKAEEKLLINREFRDMYFEAEEIINREIG